MKAGYIILTTYLLFLIFACSSGNNRPVTTESKVVTDTTGIGEFYSRLPAVNLPLTIDSSYPVNGLSSRSISPSVIREWNIESNDRVTLFKLSGKMPIHTVLIVYSDSSGIESAKLYAVTDRYQLADSLHLYSNEIVDNGPAVIEQTGRITSPDNIRVEKRMSGVLIESFNML